MTQSLRTYTIDEAKLKLESYCSYQERSHRQVQKKLIEMRMITEAQEVIITHLIHHNFLNETRFAQSFTRGKFRIKKWGKQRIIRTLKEHGVSAYNIKIGLSEIDSTEYLQVFDDLVEKRLTALSYEQNTSKRKRKLFDYLAYRGWESELIYSALSRA